MGSGGGTGAVDDLLALARDAGRTDEAIAELRLALRAARNCPDPARVVEVQATFGLTLVRAGRTAAGLRLLDKAVAASSGGLAGRTLMHRGEILVTLGRHDEALRDLGRAIRLLSAAGDVLWEGRAHSRRGLAYLDLGQTSRAQADFTLAQDRLDASGQELESATAVHNRGLVALRAGHLQAALARLDEAGGRYAALGARMPELAVDRCSALLVAGLAAEAVEESELALAALARTGGHATTRAELHLSAGAAALAAGRPDRAARHASAARDQFTRQRRPWWRSRATLVLLRARSADGAAPETLLPAVCRLAGELTRQRADQAADAHLFAGETALAAGRLALATRHLERAASLGARGTSMQRGVGWLARARLAEARGDEARALRACGCGLAAIDQHLRTLGVTELRAHANAHGVDLAVLAQRIAVRRGDARLLWRWSERRRASVLMPLAEPPPADPALARNLAALRAVARQAEAARSAGAPTARLDAERLRLEAVIRAVSRRWQPEAAGTAVTSLDELMAALGDIRLAQIVEVDDRLFVITVADGRVRLREAGSARQAVRETEFARFLLRRLANGPPPARLGPRLASAGLLLERALLGSAARDIAGGPVVIVPPGRLHAVPWAMLPSLASVAVRVAPSASSWLAAHRSPPPRQRRVALVVGPGLTGTGTEVSAIADGYASSDAPVVLRGGAATAERTLDALNGAWIAHVAAHGVFRADSPLFSALDLDDGPLTVHDLARLRRAPYRLVLASCESAVAASAGDDEVVGALSVLLPRGTASLVASVVPVNDAATTPLMVRLHDRLRAGAGVAQALRDARAEREGDPAALAAAFAFVAHGQ